MTDFAANERLVRAYFDAVAAIDPSAFVPIMTPDAKLRFSGGNGAETALVRDVQSVMNEMKDIGKIYDVGFGIRPEILNFVMQDNKVAVEVTIRGRAARDGRPYHNLYAFFFWIRDGKIAEVHEHLDSAYSFERLLGPNPDLAKNAKVEPAK